MSNVIDYSLYVARRRGPLSPSPALEPTLVLAPPEGVAVMAPRPARRVARALWTMTALVWPVLKWGLAVDVFVRFVIMTMTWHSPGNHNGWLFLLHFGVLTALSFYVGAYRPRGGGD